MSFHVPPPQKIVLVHVLLLKSKYAMFIALDQKYLKVLFEIFIKVFIGAKL